MRNVEAEELNDRSSPIRGCVRTSHYPTDIIGLLMQTQPFGSATDDNDFYDFIQEIL